MWDVNNISELTELEEYQQWVWNTTTPKNGPEGAWWAASGLTAEAGEVISLFEKAYRKGQPMDINKLMDELGDVLWFLTAVCNMTNLTLDEVMTHNIEKINKRVANGQVTSEG